jgi:hypothetical protein
VLSLECALLTDIECKTGGAAAPPDKKRSGRLPISAAA